MLQKFSLQLEALLAAVNSVVVASVAVGMVLLAYVLDPAADQWLVSVWCKIHFPFHG